MKIRSALTLLSVLVLGVALQSYAAAAVPSAPTPIAPANGAGVVEPFTISWSVVSDPSGIIAYNWQVSPTSSFATVILLNSTSGQTQDIVSGLANGTYFWRVQAVSGAFVQGAWSPTRSFVVTGVGPGAPGRPTLAPTQGYSTFHPLEVITFNWTAVPGAASYLLQASTSASFPVLTRIQFDNIPNTTFSFAIGHPDQGNYSARVFAVSANGVASAPSNLITFSVFFNNPLPAPPSPLTPANGATLTLPVTLTWTNVPNPQPGGYDLQIAKNSSFSTIEDLATQLNEPSRTVLSLTPGTKFWRVHSVQGDASPTTAAVTAWSAVRSFTISAAPARPVSLTLANDPLFSGDSTFVAVQLTAGVPASGATITMSSSNPAAAAVPPAVSILGNTAWTQFQMQAGQVTTPTPVTLTATLNSVSASVAFSVRPPSLKSLWTPSSISGGALVGAIVMLNGQAPPGGAVVSISSNSPAVSAISPVTVLPGNASISFAMPSSAVATNTPVTITATWNGASAQSQVTLTPQPPPASLTLSPTSITGTGSSFAIVTIASPATTDVIFQISSSNPAVASVNNGVMIPFGVMAGGFNIFTTLVTVATQVTISVSGGGVTKTAILTVNPLQPPAAALSALAFSPTSIVGGGLAQGTVTLTSGAPTGGALVALTSSNSALASVPTSVNVLAGAASAGFSISTSAVSASTPVTISAVFNGVTRTSTLTVTPPQAPASLQSLSLNPASVSAGTSSQGTLRLTSSAPSAGALITLASSNPAVASVPASVTVTAGATSRVFTLTTTNVTASTAVTITAAFAGVTRTATLTVSPAPTGTLPAATLLSPAVDARFPPGQAITFDWSDVAGAASYLLQIDDESGFSAPFTLSQTVTASQSTISTLPTLRMWWRVRANDAAGNPGAWSSSRRFEVRP